MKKTLTLLTLGILFLSLKAYPAIANDTPVEINEYSQLSGTNIHISPQYENLIDSDKKNIITVLTIDGGGMHGIIPLKVLEQIETETNMPISSLFNFMGGTSTGAIITSLLSLPDSDGSKCGNSIVPQTNSYMVDATNHACPYILAKDGSP